MGLFRKGRREAKHLSQHQEKTAGRIAEKILAVQRMTAAELNARAQKLGKKNTLIILVALVIGLGCYSAWLIASAIF